MKKPKAGKAKRKLNRRFGVAKKAVKQKVYITKSLLRRRPVTDDAIAGLAKMGKKYGIASEIKKDYGYGPIDLVWNIKAHPSFRPIACGFIRFKKQNGSSDLDNRRFSLLKIEEALMIGIRSGMDRLFLLCDNEDIAKSVTGQIEWLSSFGSLLRFDSFSAGVYPGQNGQIKMVTSQERSKPDR